ncbi:MAG: 4-(cytidine 5'-diphospho)-2-C-methyl-D-erythritol kinase, partial [Elusimicrobia bacterium]|nr:4-(cytidine 5'-diphospho)-2-C-methyl-D-erythritol kinase [Elusimicrobiota bacterium]
MVVWAPAKINLYLDVLGPRPDGYHSIETLFAKINLRDRLRLGLLPRGRRDHLSVRGPFGALIPPGPANLALRAARAFKARFGISRPVFIELDKRIPVGAGLGGGSSDAAAVLTGLSRLFKLPETAAHVRALKTMALGIGSDVPFFLEKAGFAVGRGRGERLSAFEVGRPFSWAVLVYPGLQVSTKEIYQNLRFPSKKPVLTRARHLGRLKKSLERGPLPPGWEGWLYNRLQEIVLSYHPEVAGARDRLLSLGARAVLVS